MDWVHSFLDLLPLDFCFTLYLLGLTLRLTDANGVFNKCDSYETMLVGFQGASLSQHRAFIL